MADTTRTVVKFNSREQILSGDLNRVQKLVSRDAHNILEAGARRDGFAELDGSPLSPGFLGTPADTGSPITRANAIGGIATTVGSFTFTVGAGEVEAEIFSGDPDASSYQVLRWPDTQFTSAPDGSQSRIDLVYATPAMVDSDLESRNVLLDPVARTVAPQNVFKTSDPTATLMLLPGTPGSNVAPAAPVGSVAIWEVVTLDGDADSTAYRYIRRVWRRVESFGTCHAILEGCTPFWPTADDGGVTTRRPMLADGAVHRAIIDGEVIVWVAGGELRAVTDSNGDPTAMAAAAFDQPYYLYLCGGRSAPQQGLPFNSPFQTFSPLRLVASTQAPGVGGRSSGDLAFGGVSIPIAGTLFVGVGFMSTQLGSVFFKPCVIDGDWVYPKTSQFVTPSFALQVPQWPQFTEAPILGVSTSGPAVIHPPALATMCDLAACVFDSTPAVALAAIYPGSSVGSGNQVLLFVIANPSGAAGAPVGRTRCAVVPASGALNWSGALSNPTVARLDVMATGYNMGVKRIG